MLLQLLRAIAITARPWLLAAQIPALVPMMRILHADQLEILLPVRPLLRHRDVAEAAFAPAEGSIVPQPRIGHVPQILPARARAPPQPAALDRLQRRRFLPWFHSRGH